MNAFARSLFLASAAVAGFVGVGPASAADMTPADAITGTMRIEFPTRTQTVEDEMREAAGTGSEMVDNALGFLQDAAGGKLPAGVPQPGVKDIYTQDLWVAGALHYTGTIERQPWIPYATTGNTAQQGGMVYDVTIAAKNPQNPSQEKRLSKVVGSLTFDGYGVYRLDTPVDGGSRLRLEPVEGAAKPEVVNFGGTMQGRFPKQYGAIGSWREQRHTEPRRYCSRNDQNVVSCYVPADTDPMEFRNTKVAGGPVTFPALTLNGHFDYIPDTGAWEVDFTASYQVKGQSVTDRFSGKIYWLEDANRNETGHGWYDVAVNLNEKAVSETEARGAVELSPEDALAAAFNTNAGEEVDPLAALAAAFDAPQKPGFFGTIDYVDTFGNDGETVTASALTFGVKQIGANSTQVLIFKKVLDLVVGPFNDEENVDGAAG